MSEIKDYNEDIQYLFLQFLISDSDLFARCQNIVNPEFFSRKYKPTVELLVSHSKDYNSLPTIVSLKMFKAVAGLP